MIGPVTYLLHFSFPQIMQIQVSWKRINSLMEEVAELEKKKKTVFLSNRRLKRK
jgi:hypothetical protein